MLLQVWPAVAVAVAVTRHGLYAIDRLFTRTLVYVLLTALLVGDYAVVALLAGLLAGDSAFSASLATLAAALLFRPLRDRVQAPSIAASPGPASTPCGCCATSSTMCATAGPSPRTSARSLALALGDPTRRDPLPAARDRRLRRPPRPADRELPDDGRERSPIGRDRELGVLLHAPASRRTCCAACSTPPPLPVELARLRVELRLQLAEVESSRARIAQAGYEERRRLERDLHDGAQQRLVTLGIMLRRLQRSLPREARMLSPALDAAVDEVAARSATCARSPPACGRRGSTRAWPPRSRTWPAARRCPVDVAATPTARRPRSRPPPTSWPARR